MGTVKEKIQKIGYSIYHVETPPPPPVDPYYTTEFVQRHPDGSFDARQKCTKPGYEWERIVTVGNLSALLQPRSEPTESLGFREAQTGVFARLGRIILSTLRPRHKAEMDSAPDLLL